MTDAIEQAEYEERIQEVKDQVRGAIEFSIPTGFVFGQTDNDLLYSGPLSPLLEIFQEYRSEIEELG